jgi:uncharacterized protein
LAKKEDPEAQKFRDYFDWTEPLKSIPSHRMLAIRRGEKEGFLLMRIQPMEAEAIALVERLTVKGNNACSAQVKLAAQDAYKRLLSSSMETEARLESKKKADAEAVKVFRGQSARIAARGTAGSEACFGHRPRFPHGLQGRGARCAGAASSITMSFTCSAMATASCTRRRCC